MLSFASFAIRDNSSCCLRISNVLPIVRALSQFCLLRVVPFPHMGRHSCLVQYHDCVALGERPCRNPGLWLGNRFPILTRKVYRIATDIRHHVILPVLVPRPMNMRNRYKCGYPACSIYHYKAPEVTRALTPRATQYPRDKMIPFNRECNVETVYFPTPGR